MPQASFQIDHDLRQELMDHLVSVLHQRCKEIPASQLYVLAVSFDRFAQIKSTTIRMYVQQYQEKFTSYHSALPLKALSYMYSSVSHNAPCESVHSSLTDSFATNQSVSTPPPSSSSSSSSSSTPNNLDFRTSSSLTDAQAQSKLGPFVSQPLSKLSSPIQDSSQDFDFMHPSLQAHSSSLPTHLSNPYPRDSSHEINSRSFFENEFSSVPYTTEDKDHHLFFLSDNDLTFPNESLYFPLPSMHNQENTGPFFPTP